jgi:hypothetical protein
MNYALIVCMYPNMEPFIAHIEFKCIMVKP